MNSEINHSLSLANPSPESLNTWQKAGSLLGVAGVALLALALFGIGLESDVIMLSISLISMVAGAGIYAYGSYAHKPAGIKNDHVWHMSLTSRGLWAWVFGILITAFYIILYWYPEYLGYDRSGGGANNSGLVALFDPLSKWLKGEPASQWFVYGTLYTIAILGMGIKYIPKYRHNRYQIIRTLSVMFFQLGFAFLLPEFLLRMELPYNDFKNMWPLNFYFFHDWSIKGMLQSGNIGLFMLIWGVALIFLVSPLLTYFYGKRWYCSWVCGCGGLAETAGDPFRHLSDKSLKAWRIERWLIHSVLVLVTIVTIAILFSFTRSNAESLAISHTHFGAFVILLMGALAFGTWYFRDRLSDIDRKIRNLIFIILGAIILFTAIALFFSTEDVFLIDTYQLRRWYGFFISSAFAGVIGVGFYPLMGSRVWCRFGCPAAAILGLQQKFFSRFRITTNGDQCISCGNCSTYCEQGIDVRWYAQRGQNIVRASCVGCGICAAVCPRGVLRLENGPDKKDRKGIQAVHISRDEVGLIS